MTTPMYGPQSPAVTALVERLQAMTTGEAKALAAAWDKTGRGDAARYAAWGAKAAARAAAWNAARVAARFAEWYAAGGAAGGEGRHAAGGAAWGAAVDAAGGLVVLDLAPEAALVLLGPVIEVLGLDWCPAEARALIEGRATMSEPRERIQP